MNSSNKHGKIAHIYASYSVIKLPVCASSTSSSSCSNKSSTNWTRLLVGGTTRRRINPTPEGSNSLLERWASGSKLSLNILTKGNSSGGRIPHPGRTIRRRPARRPVHEDGGDPRHRGGPRRRAEARVPGRLDGERRGASLSGLTAGAGGIAGARERRAGGRRVRAKGRMANGGE